MELYLRPDNDLPDKRVDIDTPLLIPLRLPAALLSNLTRDSRLDINTTRATTSSSSAADENDDSGVTLTITHHPHSSGKQEMSSGGEIYSMGIIDHHNQKAMDWYRHRTTSADHENNVSSSTRGNELQFIGTTNKQYSTTTTKPTKHSASSHKLKEIGERTRRLLEEERRKRKEIVRLEDHEQSILALPEKHAPPPLAPSIPTSLTTEKKSMNAARKRKRRIVPSNIDGWMPNVDDLRKLPTMNIAPSTKRLVDQQQQQQSSIVRLHGLPMGVKPEHIRKFFHGLNPDRIFVLPSFSQTIQGWDATAATSSDNGYNQQCIVKRHSTTFRVFVKFASSPVANAAIERTGEPIGFDEEREEGDIDGKAVRGREKIVGASISISPISKQDAAFLQKHMAIDTQKGEAIIATAQRIEEQIGTAVMQLIWQMAIKKLNLSHRLGGRGYSTTTDHDCTVPQNETQYQTLAKLYNTLIDAHEKLELDSGVIFTHAFDPSIDDSASRITQSVSNWLLDRVSTIGRLLNESRQWLKLGTSNY